MPDEEIHIEELELSVRVGVPGAGAGAIAAPHRFHHAPAAQPVPRPGRRARADGGLRRHCAELQRLVAGRHWS